MIEALVVDDEYFVRKGLISTMPWEQFGIRIAGEASNGIKALEFMRSEPVDLLITDLAMPVMNGFDLMRQVSEEFQKVNVVVLSCHEDFKYVQDALRLGALDYIVKTELENESMEDSLKRITARLTLTNDRGGEKPVITSPIRSMWTEASELKLLAHLDAWLPLHWVLSDDAFEAHRRTLVELGPSVARLQQMAHYLLVEWNRTIRSNLFSKFLSESEHISDWSEWDRFITDLRNTLRDHLLVSSYPEDIVERILQAVELVKADPGTNMTQNELAKQLKINRGLFSKCFKDLTGKTFHTYIKEQRIAKAKTLLLHTAKPIPVIAEECGFLDSRYFSRQFREETGKLPSEYRMSLV